MIKFAFWKGDSAVHFHSSVAVTTSQTKGHGETVKQISNAQMVCYNNQALCTWLYKCLKFLSFDYCKVKMFILPTTPIHCWKSQMSKIFFFFNFIIRKEKKADRKVTKIEKEKKTLTSVLFSKTQPSTSCFPTLVFSYLHQQPWVFKDIVSTH